ncbi:MAG TPA: hypothetical protein VKU94_00690 [Geobacterales bacterium]|nr:hypothetical protein [Geobacterales bacterium]
MILIWINYVDEKNLKGIFRAIENWEEFKAIIEHENSYYLISTKRIHRKLKRIGSRSTITKSQVIKVLKKVYRGELYSMKTRFRKKENILKKYKDEHLILFLKHG